MYKVSLKIFNISILFDVNDLKISLKYAIFIVKAVVNIPNTFSKQKMCYSDTFLKIEQDIFIALIKQRESLTVDITQLKMFQSNT